MAVLPPASGRAREAVAVFDNPAGTHGFAFAEFAAPDAAAMAELFRTMGFTGAERHRTRDVVRLRQGEMTFFVNGEPGGFAASFAARHGAGVCGFGFRVRDARAALRHAVSRGAIAGEEPGELAAPFIEGIGGSRLYLVDDEVWAGIEADFTPLFEERAVLGVGLREIDHLTHNVERGSMDRWAAFYERTFNFRQIRFFDIEGKLTGLRSRAMTSPCGRIRIPINESADDKSQIAEYLEAYNGEGVQHIALSTDDIFHTVGAMREAGVPFMDPPPDAYYEALDARVPGHGEDIDRLRQSAILIDGAEGEGILLQIFTRTLIGPIFFEIIQRKENDGFGEGNFRALFEAMERDQIRRGVLRPEAETR